MESVWFAVVTVGGALLAWLGHRIEPHWVSKDGRRFLCNAQRLTTRGEAQTRWREARVTIGDTAEVRIDERRFLGRTSTVWKVVSRADAPPRGREVFLLSGLDDGGGPALLALRLPRRSPVVVRLQDLITS